MCILLVLVIIFVCLGNMMNTVVVLHKLKSRKKNLNIPIYILLILPCTRILVYVNLTFR